MSDRLTAARDALKALHDFLWDQMEWFSDESAPMPRYTTMAHGQKHDDLVERFHDAYPELLAAAEAPGRVAALEVQEVLDVIGEHEGNGCCDPKTLEHVAQDIHGRALAVPAPTPSEPVERSGGARHWTLWESEVTDGWTILDPDGFRHGKPTEVTKEEFERARNECTLIRDESRGQYGLPPRPTPATRDE